MEHLNRSEIDYTVESHDLTYIFNYNERAILEILREIYASGKTMCRCALCVEDTYALALNTLPARYVQETRVGTYERSTTCIPESEIRAKVEEAVAKVTDNPNH